MTSIKSEPLFINHANALAKKIRHVLESTPAYKSDFSQNNSKATTGGASSYELRPTMKVNKNESVYSKQYVNKTIVSVDISSGNFTCLKYHDPSLLLNSESYRDMVEKIARMELAVPDSSGSGGDEESELIRKSDFSDAVIEYVIKSKLLRQVIFGHLNPKRQQVIQKFLVGLVIETLVDHAGVDRDRFISCSSDEVVFICRESSTAREDYEATKNAISAHLPELAPNLKVEVFDLKCIEDDRTKRVAGYVKEFLFNSHSKGQAFEIKSVPGYLFAQAYKTYLGLPIEDNDLCFMYEGMVASFKQSFFQQQQQ